MESGSKTDGADHRVVSMCLCPSASLTLCWFLRNQNARVFVSGCEWVLFPWRELNFVI